jgi:undecaprenyl-diphosphatase
MDTPAENTRHTRHLGTALIELLQEVGIFALIGIIGAIGLLLLFAWLSEEVFTQEFTSLDNNTALWVHGFASPALDTLFNAFSALGSFGVVALTVIAFGYLFWKKHMHDAWRLLIAVIGGLLINQGLKLVFHRPRPDLWDQAGVQFAGFSFPSGHSTLSLCLFGMFIWLGWEYMRKQGARVAWAVLMVLIIAMVGLSRIYLGAHYLTDVLAGYISGTFWLVALLTGSDIYDRLKAQAASTGGTR